MRFGNLFVLSYYFIGKAAMLGPLLPHRPCCRPPALPPGQPSISPSRPIQSSPASPRRRPPPLFSFLFNLWLLDPKDQSVACVAGCYLPVWVRTAKQRAARIIGSESQSGGAGPSRVSLVQEHPCAPSPPQHPSIPLHPRKLQPHFPR